MTDLTYYEVLFNDIANPCCVSDIETHEVIFLNRAMLKLLNCHEEFQREKCYKILQNKESPCDFCPNQRLEVGVFIENNIYHPLIGRHFRINSTLMELHGRKLNVSKYFVNASYSNQELSFDEAMTECLEVLKNDNIETILNSFLALLGNFYKCRKSYLFQFDSENFILTNNFSWMAAGEERLVTDLFHDMPYETITKYLSTDHTHDILKINLNSDTIQKDSPEYQLLSIHRVDNIILSPVKNSLEEIIGFLGISNYSEMEIDFRLLKAVTNFVEESFSRQTMIGELQYLSLIDPLTGLGSRQRYGEMYQELTYTPPYEMGVVFINLNGLRKTNECFGYEHGDRQLKETAEFVQSFFEEPFYRISGDEFVCFVPNCKEENFQKRVGKLRKKQKELNNFSFSVGDTWKSHPYDLGKMISDADTMMYINKQEYYHDAHDSKPIVSKGVLDDLLSALENEEFVVYLQAKVDLSTDKVVGAEALVRRVDPLENNLIYPDSFIPLYEKNSIIRHVDLYVLDKVCGFLSLWGKHFENMSISVNLSRVTLLEHGIVNTITAICDNYQIPHKSIIIEVTERVGLIENDVASSLIANFKEHGFSISLDDFGCAYSNIITLAQIEFNEVKIDKSLIDNLLHSEKNQVIVENMLRMCNKLKETETLAEGIEVKEQADLLKKYGCTHAQGYFYSHPLPHEEFYDKFVKNPYNF